MSTLFAFWYVDSLKRYSTAALAVLVIATSPPLAAHDSSIVLDGAGTAAIDGILSAGEWDNAGRLDFAANIPAHDGGGTTPATLFVMRDGSNLYLAVKLQRRAYGGATQTIFEFDNDHDGLNYEPGDDAVLPLVSTFEAPRYFDIYRHPCADSSDPGFAGCSSQDVADGGTTDGAVAASNDGTHTVMEISHPLNSADDAHDLNLAAGDSVGFQFILHLFSLDAPCNEAPQCVADTTFSGDIGVARPPTQMAIDVKPGSSTHPVNLRSRGVIPVAVLSSSRFDALQLDPATVCFGDAEQPGQRDCSEAHDRGHADDVNADGIADLVLHFETAETGIDPGDTRACLVGSTFAGTAIEACDAITTVDAARATGQKLMRPGKRQFPRSRTGALRGTP